MIMARKSSGMAVLGVAKEILRTTKSVDELRISQAVIFPLEKGMTIAETAACIGRSVRWTTEHRTAFIKAGGLVKKNRPGGRKRENMTVEEEKVFLEPFFEKAQVGGILVVGEIHKALEEHLGRHVALASAYNLLHRHNWRKLAPDKRHVDSDVAVQESWKKNSRSF